MERKELKNGVRGKRTIRLNCPDFDAHFLKKNHFLVFAVRTFAIPF